MNKLPTPKKTKKKFYNKYIYKITLNLKGSVSLRYNSLDEVLNKCVQQDFSAGTKWRDRVFKELRDNSHHWIKLIGILNQYDNKTWSKRLEGDYIDFYTNDKSMYETIGSEFEQFCVLRSQPEKGKEQQLLESNKEIFCKKLPHDKYQFKVYLKPHRVRRDEKAALANWLDNQRPNITFTSSIKKWLLSTESNWDRRYIYVDNESTLLMIKLRSSEVLGRVHKYVINR